MAPLALTNFVYSALKSPPLLWELCRGYSTISIYIYIRDVHIYFCVLWIINKCGTNTHDGNDYFTILSIIQPYLMIPPCITPDLGGKRVIPNADMSRRSQTTLVSPRTERIETSYHVELVVSSKVLLKATSLSN